MSLSRLVICAVLLCCAVGPASAARVYNYLGYYSVYDGPAWITNPTSYSAREAAALVFGGSYTDYAISVDPTQDSSTITFTGWYDGWNDHVGRAWYEDYKVQNGSGYASTDLFGANYSAFVSDGLDDRPDRDRFRNYVWLIEDIPEVPEPSTIAAIGAGLLALAALQRRRLG